MTQQKLPITVETAANAIFQQWRIGQNATVESVMNALGTSHRQKVNDFMPQARLKAGEMIQTREAESQLSEKFPAEAFTAIRSWAEQVADTRLTNRTQALNEQAANLIEARQAMDDERETLTATIVRLETREQQLTEQVSATEQRLIKAETNAQAKIDGLESALNDARARASQAETRFEITQHELSLERQSNQRHEEEHTVLRRRYDAYVHEVETLKPNLARVTQELEHQLQRYASMEIRHQERESMWLSERDQRLTNELKLQSQNQQQVEEIEKLSSQYRQSCDGYNELSVTHAKTLDELKALEQKRLGDQRQAKSLEAQLQSQLTASEDQFQRLISLERQNATLHAELNRKSTKVR